MSCTKSPPMPWDAPPSRRLVNEPSRKRASSCDSPSTQSASTPAARWWRSIARCDQTSEPPALCDGTEYWSAAGVSLARSGATEENVLQNDCTVPNTSAATVPTDGVSHSSPVRKNPDSVSLCVYGVPLSRY